MPTRKENADSQHSKINTLFQSAEFHTFVTKIMRFECSHKPENVFCATGFGLETPELLLGTTNGVLSGKKNTELRVLVQF